MSNTFCPLPWMHLATHPDGKVTLCCVSDHTNNMNAARTNQGQVLNLNKNKIIEIVNSDYFVAVRQEMSQNQKPHACLRCYEEEEKLMGSKREIELVRFGKGKKILYPNTNSGYGLGKGQTECNEESPLTPISVYGQTKCDAENFLRTTTNAIIFRLATVFGVSPRMRTDLLVNDFTYKALTQGYLVVYEKHFMRTFIHVHDMGRVFLFGMENSNVMRNNFYKTNDKALAVLVRNPENLPLLE